MHPKTRNEYLSAWGPVLSPGGVGNNTRRVSCLHLPCIYLFCFLMSFTLAASPILDGEILCNQRVFLGARVIRDFIIWNLKMTDEVSQTTSALPGVCYFIVPAEIAPPRAFFLWIPRWTILRRDMSSSYYFLFSCKCLRAVCFLSSYTSDNIFSVVFT